MARKVQQFKHSPEAYSYGQYVFEDSQVDEFQDILGSDGLPSPADKYNDKALYSTVVGEDNRDYIIQNKLRRIGSSYIQINEFRVDNRHSTSRVRDTFFQGLIFDTHTFNCYRSTGKLKSYGQLRNALNGAGSTDSESRVNGFSGDNKEFRLDQYASFFKWDAPRYGKGKGPGNFDFLKDQIIIENFDSIDVLETPSFSRRDNNFIENGMKFDYPEGTGGAYEGQQLKQPFHPSDHTDSKVTQIFNEDGEQNFLQFMFYLKGNKQVSKHGGKQSASNRIYVFRVNPNNLFTTDGLGKVTELDFRIGGNGINYRQDSGQDLSSRWEVTRFRVTIDTQGGASREEYEEAGINLEIADKIKPPIVLREDFLDEDFLDYNIYAENFTNALTSPGTNTYGINFTPVPLILSKNTDINLQTYRQNDMLRQLTSAPGNVSVRLYTSNFTTSDQILNNVFTTSGGDSVPPYYKFCIVDWDDKENKIQTVEDVFDLKPFDEISLIEAQSNNTFNFVEIDSDLTNTYFEAGIKTIKILLFSYIQAGETGWRSDYRDYPPFEAIEPLRFKLITARIFLDIPITKYPDFGDFGGDEYTTLPWPYDTPVIGGLTENSKYYQSLTNVLQSGKITNTEIVDERFLNGAKTQLENNRIGENIQKMDLEQFRYFDKRYDMNTLLNISVNTFYNDFNYFDGETNKFSEESSVGQIFIGDNQDNDLKQSCKIEFNTADFLSKTIPDSSGNSNKGIMVGDYKIKKIRKGEPMRRDSFIKTPKKAGNTEGAL